MCNNRQIWSYSPLLVLLYPLSILLNKRKCRKTFQKFKKWLSYFYGVCKSTTTSENAEKKSLFLVQIYSFSTKYVWCLFMLKLFQFKYAEFLQKKSQLLKKKLPIKSNIQLIKLNLFHWIFLHNSCLLIFLILKAWSSFNWFNTET